MFISRHDNIAAVEYIRLRRRHTVRGFQMRGFRWFIKLILIACCVLAGFVLFTAIFQPGRSMDWNSAEIGIALLCLLVLLIHFIILYRTLTLASDTIVREKREKTWESLILTGVHSRQVIRGKWWAVIQGVWPDYLRLSLMRIGASIGVGLVLYFIYVQMIMGTQPFAQIIPSPERILLSAVFIVLLTLSNGLYTASAGIVGGLLTSRHDDFATPMAQAVRMAGLLAPIVTFFVVGLYLFEFPIGPRIAPEVVLPILLLALLFLDNGILIAAAILNPHDHNTVLYVFIGIIGVMLYGVLTMTMLHIGELIARRQGVLPFTRQRG